MISGGETPGKYEKREKLLSYKKVTEVSPFYNNNYYNMQASSATFIIFSKDSCLARAESSS